MRNGGVGMMALVLTACGNAPDGAANAGDPIVSASRENAAASSPEPRAPATLVLTGKGLQSSDPATGAVTAIPFGMAEDRAIALIAAALGKPDQRDTNNDCPTGPVQVAAWGKGLSALFQDAAFVGWAGAVDLKTAAGIGFGSRRADLMNAYDDATVEQTSLGTEFTAGGISGVLESDAPGAAISDMWAGVSCVAR